ncbi:hypothetical protein N7486_009919 [Penicillium sp. IBT 16267x]|nr:hypothetical protein N7486_009919 [Penicillium sp. IBT 16267x]
MNGHVQSETRFDVVIVGAGISGINAAYRLQDKLPGYSYTIIEARDDLGGTWDLFKYPGIRSDSDLFTFGFSFHPWNQSNPIVDGHLIKDYIRDTAKKFGIDKNIQYRHRLSAANWSSEDNYWSLNIDNNGTAKTINARFIIFGSGYYNYHEPLEATIPGLENFQGQVIHPQFWPEDLDYTGKKVVIIGSGATAITLLPNLAQKAERVTMVQRSPTYILSLPNRSGNWLLRWILPTSAYNKLLRLIWIIQSRLFFLICQTFPNFTRWVLKRRASRQLPSHIPHDPHFQPRYNPWDQRICVSPDGDFYTSLRRGKGDVRTDTIKNVTKNGLTLNSGETLDADIIITATGLKLQIAGGTTLTVDGEKIDIGSKYLWHGVMLQDLPNASFIIGYTNASWTLGADATAQFVTRLLKSLETRKLIAATPRLKAQDAETIQQRPLLNLNSTYVTVSNRVLPLAADRGPWQARDHYFKDMKFATKGNLDDSMEYVQGQNLHLRAIIA